MQIHLAILDRFFSRIAQRTLSLAPANDLAELTDHSFPRALYVHVPFCTELCSYCSFYRVRAEGSDMAGYFSALRREIRLLHDRGAIVETIYVGGGTPTIAPNELARTILEARERWKIRELSVETNPDQLSESVLKALEDIGVDRLSVGVQSFDDDVLALIGRSARGRGSDIARQISDLQGRFPTLNIDMMFNLPEQSDESLRGDLDTILRLAPDQVTWYPLIGVSPLPRDRRRREERMVARVADALAPRYANATAWCFNRLESRPGDGARSEEVKGEGSPGLVDEYIVGSREYYAAGAGAFGYVAGGVYANSFDLADYAARLAQGRLPVLASAKFTPRQNAHYELLVGLFGGRIDLRAASHGFLRRVWPALLLFLLIGAVRFRMGSLELTPSGRYPWIVMMRGFFTAVNGMREVCGRLAHS